MKKRIPGDLEIRSSPHEGRGQKEAITTANLGGFTTLFCAYLALRAIACGVLINGLLPTCSTTCILLLGIVAGGFKSRGDL